MRNQFVPTSFIERLRADLARSTGNLSEDAKRYLGYFENGWLGNNRAYDAYVYTFKGKTHIHGVPFEIAVARHHHNVNRHRKTTDEGNHSYYVLFRSLRDGKIAIRSLSFTDGELDLLRSNMKRHIVSEYFAMHSGKLMIPYADGKLVSNGVAIGNKISLSQSDAEHVARHLFDQLDQNFPKPGRGDCLPRNIRDSIPTYGKLIRQEAIAHRDRVFLAFFSELRTDVLDFMASHGEYRVDMYNNFCDKDCTEKTFTFRRLALDVLARAEQSPLRWKTPRAAKFWTEIDKGESPIVGTAAAFGIPNLAARQILLPAGVPETIRKKVLTGYQKKFDGEARYFSFCPELPVPRSDVEWAGFISVRDKANILVQDTHNPRATAPMMMRLWQSQRGLKTWKDIGDRISDEDMLDLRDFVKKILDQTVLPVLMREPRKLGWRKGSDAHDFCKNVFNTFSLPQLSRASQFWHEYYRLFPQGVNPQSSEQALKWIPLFDSTTATVARADGTSCRITIDPIETTSGLHAERAAMNHCVDTYAWRCYTGASFVFSLKDEVGNRLSTLELVDISKETGPFSVRINQNRGIKNVKPAEEALVAGLQIVERINHPVTALPTNIALIRIEQAEQKRLFEAKGDGLDQGAREMFKRKLRVGFDHTNLEMCDQVLRLYLRGFPSKIRDHVKNVPDWIEFLDIAKILRGQGCDFPRRNLALRRTQRLRAPGE